MGEEGALERERARELKDETGPIRGGRRKRERVQCPGQAFNAVERNETRGPKKNRNRWPHTFSIFLSPLALHDRKVEIEDRRL